MSPLESALLAQVADPIPPYRAEVMARSEARFARYLERHAVEAKP